MRRRVYRSELDGPGVVTIQERADYVTVEYLGHAVQRVKVSEVRRGVAFPTGDGHELALLDGGRGSRIIVKLDGERLTPTVTQFNWVGYAPHVLLATALMALTIAGLAYAGFEPAWRVAIRREPLLLGSVFLALFWTRTRWANPLVTLMLLGDLVWVLSSGIWSPATLVLRLLLVGFFGRVSFAEWRAIPG